MNEVLYLIDIEFHVINKTQKGPKFHVKVVRRYRNNAAALHLLKDGLEVIKNTFSRPGIRDGRDGMIASSRLRGNAVRRAGARGKPAARGADAAGTGSGGIGKRLRTQEQQDR
jgi:hypothetical protein